MFHFRSNWRRCALQGRLLDATGFCVQLKSVNVTVAITNRVSDIITQTNSGKQNGMVEDLIKKLFLGGPQSFKIARAHRSKAQLICARSEKNVQKAKLTVNFLAFLSMNFLKFGSVVTT